MRFGEQLHRNGKMTKKDKAALAAATLAVMAFTSVFLLQLWGGWDASGRYGIKEITGSRDVGMEQALIDRDELTSWGSYNYWEKPKADDYLCFSFRKEKQLRGIRIDGITPDILIFLGRSGGEWKEISFFAPRDGLYIFDREVTVEELKIAASPEARKLKWDVKEIAFYEDTESMGK